MIGFKVNRESQITPESDSGACGEPLVCSEPNSDDEPLPAATIGQQLACLNYEKSSQLL